MSSTHTPLHNVSGDELQQKLGSLFWIIAVITTLLTILLGVIGSFVVPAFSEVYASFGANLPAPTKWLTQGLAKLWMAFFIAVAMWVYCWISPSRYKRRARITIGFFTIGVISAFALMFATWALYLPIFKLGSVA